MGDLASQGDPLDRRVTEMDAAPHPCIHDLLRQVSHPLIVALRLQQVWRRARQVELDPVRSQEGQPALPPPRRSGSHAPTDIRDGSVRRAVASRSDRRPSRGCRRCRQVEWRIAAAKTGRCTWHRSRRSARRRRPGCPSRTVVPSGGCRARDPARSSRTRRCTARLGWWSRTARCRSVRRCGMGCRGCRWS